MRKSLEYVRKSPEYREKQRVSHLGEKHSIKTRVKMSLAQTGELNYRWVKDRNELAKRHMRNDMAYRDWRRSIWDRDGFKCRINNVDCDGRIEVHHILGWTNYPELQYEINNGITLCHAHHPRKRAEEKLLIPEFQRLVEVSREII